MSCVPAAANVEQGADAPSAFTNAVSNACQLHFWEACMHAWIDGRVDNITQINTNNEYQANMIG